MSDRDPSAPAENADPSDFAPEPNAHEVALSLPDDGFDFDDDDGDPNPGDPAYDHAERVVEQPRGERGRFASRNPPQEPQDGEGEGEADDNEAEGADAASEPQDGEKEPEAEKPEDKAKAEDKPAPYIEIDGRKLTAEDVRGGLLMRADYTRKTQAHAEDVRQFQAVRQQTEAERTELGSILNIALEVLQKRMPQPPDRAMIREDPMGFMEQTQAYNEAVEEVNKLLGAQQQIGQRQTAEQKQAQEQAERAARTQTAEALQRQAQLMAETMPELRTAEGQKAFFADATTFGEHYGLTAEDIGGIQDHRALRVLKDAIAYRKLQAAKPEAMEKVRSAPPIRPAVRQGAGTRQGQANRQAQDAFRRNPTIDGAVASLPDSMFGLD